MVPIFSSRLRMAEAPRLHSSTSQVAASRRFPPSRRTSARAASRAASTAPAHGLLREVLGPRVAHPHRLLPLAP